MKSIFCLICFWLVGCSTTQTLTTTQVASSQMQMYNLVTSPATASISPVVGIYTQVALNAINPPSNDPEYGSKIIKKRKAHVIPPSKLPTQKQLADAKQD